MRFIGVKKAFLCVAVLAAVGVGSASNALAVTELISNGGFETGNLNSWTVTDSGSGTFNVEAGTVGTFATVGPSGGTFYAVSRQGAPGTHALSQGFTVGASVTQAILSFDMFVQTQQALAVHANGLDETAFPNQHARVDLLTAGASPFDTGAGVIANFYLGIDGQPTQPYTSYSIDITPQVLGGGNFVLRFAQVDNQGNFNQGVDNVSIAVTSDAIPEPLTASLGLMGLGVLGMVTRRRAA